VQALDQLVAPSRLHQRGERLQRHLDARQVAVVAHAQLRQPEGAQQRLGALDPRQPAGGDLDTVGDPRRQAGGGGLVGRAQAHPARGLAHVGL
jgi:hypothetical protein